MTENIYEPPKADLSRGDDDLSGQKFFPSSTKKLSLLFLTTFGLYTIYWFYKNWKIQQPRMEKKIHPALRSLFYIFFTHSLFSKIGVSAQAKNIPMKWSANMMATLLVVASILTNILDRASMETETMTIIDLLGIGTLFLMFCM